MHTNVQRRPSFWFWTRFNYPKHGIKFTVKKISMNCILREQSQHWKCIVRAKRVFERKMNVLRSIIELELTQPNQSWNISNYTPSLRGEIQKYQNGVDDCFRRGRAKNILSPLFKSIEFRRESWSYPSFFRSKCKTFEFLGMKIRHWRSLAPWFLSDD